MRRLLTIGSAVVVAAGVMAAAAAPARTAAAPVNTLPPAISGQPYVGKTLTASTGGWQNSPTSYTFQWARCDVKGNGCVQIGGATAKTYVATSADVDHTLEVLVTASVVTVTTTITASARTTICCRIVRLSGTVSPTTTGETITILAREFDDIASYPIESTTTNASGNWSVQVTPMIQTTYIAQTSTSKSNPVVVSVHPRVGFRVRGKTVSASVTARDSFAGR